MAQENVKRRTKARTRVLMTATIISAEGTHRVVVRDVSRNGAQIYAENIISEDQDACFKKGSLFVPARIAWCRNGVAGLQFYRELSASEIANAFHSVFLQESES